MKNKENTSKMEQMITAIAEKLAENRNEVTESEVRMALAKEKICTPEAMANLMDAIESKGVVVISEGYIEDSEDDADLNLVTLYFEDVSHYPLLKREEEEELIEKMRQGDKKAEEKLVNSNLRLVVSIAKRYTYKGEFLDLINSGNIGLLRGIRSYDPTKGTKLSTYATWWIKQAIVRNLANYGSTVRLPVYATEIARNIGTYITKFESENKREPSVSELSEYFCIGESTMASLMQVINGCDSLDKVISADEYSITTTKGDLLEDKNTNVEGDVLNSVMREDIFEVLNNVLTEKEADIMSLRFGLTDDGEIRSLEEIGVLYSVSRERIRQIEKKAIAKLRSSEEVFERLYPWLMSA